MRDQGLICITAGVNGSTGDMRPLIALALALRARGFEILLLGDTAFEGSALRAGITASEWFSCSDVPQTSWLRTTWGQRGLWGKRPRHRDRRMPQELLKHWGERTESFWRRVDGPTNPRIVAAIGSITAVRMLRRFAPRCAKIVSCPMPYQPSRHFTLAPPDLGVAERLRAWVRARAATGEDQRFFCEEMFHLVSASPSIFPRPADWLPNMQVTGYIPLEDDHAGWLPPEPLSVFLKQGPPPVYIGFGSHAVLLGPRGERRARQIIEGCRRRGVRCIFQCSDLPRSHASEHVFILDRDVSHAWLFPRCAAIVHHGGYGTLHAALAARRPMVIYPFQTDQFLWATRMGDLGVGPGFTARLRDLSARRVSSDLAFVLERGCQDRADKLGAAVTNDQGLTVQVAAIESIIEHTRRERRPMDWHMPLVNDDAGDAQTVSENMCALHQ